MHSGVLKSANRLRANAINSSSVTAWPGSQDNKGDHDFSPDMIRSAHNAHLTYRGMLVEDRFDLLGEILLPPRMMISFMRPANQ